MLHPPRTRAGNSTTLPNQRPRSLGELVSVKCRCLPQVGVCADLRTRSFSDWLRERVFFDKLIRKDGYSKARLGYAAPNIFVLSLSNY